MNARALPCLACLPLVLGACSGGGKAGASDQDEELCDLVSDPGTPITPSLAEEDAPNLAVDGGPYTLTLVPNQVQFVTFTVVDAGPVLLYASSDDVLTGLAAAGVQVPLVVPDDDPYCPEDLPAVYELELEAGTTVLRLGPADVTTVWFAPVTPE